MTEIDALSTLKSFLELKKYFPSTIFLFSGNARKNPWQNPFDSFYNKKRFFKHFFFNENQKCQQFPSINFIPIKIMIKTAAVLTLLQRFSLNS